MQRALLSRSWGAFPPQSRVLFASAWNMHSITSRSFATRSKVEAVPPRRKLGAPNPLSVVSLHGAKSEHVRILYQCNTPGKAKLLTFACSLQLFGFTATSILDYSLEVEQQVSLGFLNYSLAGVAFSTLVMFPLAYSLLSRCICEMAMMSPTRVRISTFNLLGRPTSFTVPTTMIAKMELSNESLMKSQFWLVNVKEKKGFFLLDKARGVVYDFAFISNMVGYTLTEEQQKIASGYTPPPQLEAESESNNNNTTDNNSSSSSSSTSSSPSSTASSSSGAEGKGAIPEKEPSEAQEKWNAAAKK